MQEVNGLDAAHKDAQTCGEGNPAQDVKGSIILAVSAQFRLKAPEKSGLSQNNSVCSTQKRFTEEHAVVFLLFPQSGPNSAPCGRQRRAKVEKSNET